MWCTSNESKPLLTCCHGEVSAGFSHGPRLSCHPELPGIDGCIHAHCQSRGSDLQENKRRPGGARVRNTLMRTTGPAERSQIQTAPGINPGLFIGWTFWTLLLPEGVHDRGFKLVARNVPHPLGQHVAVGIQQEDVRLIAVPERVLELPGIAVIDVEIRKIDLVTVLSFQPVHDGC